MKINNLLPLSSIAAITCMSNACQQQPQETKKATENPNIIIFMVDDLGWKDIACYGNDYHETPNIDRLADEGMRFTQAYASCQVCSPTRAALMTGKNPARLHLTDYISGKQAHTGVQPYHKFIVPDFHKYLPLEEKTLAENFKELGYSTAHLGKWHLGGEGHLPQDQGFDINIAGHEEGMPPTYFYPYGDTAGWHVHGLQKDGEPGEYLTDRLTDEALNILNQFKDNPFFMYMSYYSVHIPIEGKDSLINKYRQKLVSSPETFSHNHPEYAAMVEAVDHSIGRIMEKIRSYNLDNNTLVIFTSDNGGYIHEWKTPCKTTHMLPLRLGKGHLYEGGIRIPTIIRWPGVTKPGSESDEMIITSDFFPTLMDIMNHEHGKVDGVSLVPVLKGTDTLKRDELYWHYPHYHATKPCAVVREGDFKLVKYLEDERLELYNLADDIGEMYDLADDMPEKTNKMHQMLKKWWEEVDAQMPTLNPDYDPEAKK